MAAHNGRADRPTPGPWLVRGEASAGTSAAAQTLGVEPATDDQPGGWPYFLRQDQSQTPAMGYLHLATGIQRFADAKLMAAAPELAEALLRLLIAPAVRARDLDPATQGAIDAGWALLVRAAPYLEIGA